MLGSLLTDRGRLADLTDLDGHVLAAVLGCLGNATGAELPVSPYMS